MDVDKFTLRHTTFLATARLSRSFINSLSDWLRCLKVAVTRHGELQATFSTTSATWSLITQEQNRIISDYWQYIELSWHPEKGPYVHIEKRRCRTNVSDSSDARTRNHTGTVYIGSFDTSAPLQYFQVLVDEVEIWFADRDHVKAFGFLEDGE